MCLPLAARWAESLRHILHKVYEPTTRVPVPWLLTGEAALALQGVEAEPDIVEFRAVSAYAVAYFSSFMKPYEIAANAATVIYKRGGNTPPSDNWRSNVHQRIVAWSAEAGEQACWLGRWNVEGLPVQVLYVKDVQSEPLSQIGQEEIRRVSFGGMNVAVAPLEFLVAQSAMQSQTHTTNRILHALRGSGYDTNLLNKALDVLPADRATRLMRLLEIRLIAG